MKLQTAYTEKKNELLDMLAKEHFPHLDKVMS